MPIPQLKELTRILDSKATMASALQLTACGPSVRRPAATGRVGFAERINFQPKQDKLILSQRLSARPHAVRSRRLGVIQTYAVAPGAVQPPESASPIRKASGIVFVAGVHRTLAPALV